MSTTSPHHVDPMFDAERIARSGIDRLEEYLSEPASGNTDADEQAVARERLEKARMGHKALAAYAGLRSTRQREITGAFMIGRVIDAPRVALAPLFEALTGQPVAHLLEYDERSSDEAPATDASV